MPGPRPARPVLLDGAPAAPGSLPAPGALGIALLTARAKRKPPASRATAAGVLKQLPAVRRSELARVRGVVRKHLPKGYEEVVVKGMIIYQVPLERYSDTYNGQALWYVALAAQKNYLALHLVGAYGSAELRGRLVAGFKAAGKKLDMGKACIRFQSADHLALDVIGDVVAAVPLERWVAIAMAARNRKPKRTTS